MEHPGGQVIGKVPFVTIEDGTFALHPPAIEFVKTLPDRFSVCAIFGPPATGKTTLIEKILSCAQSACRPHDSDQQRNVALYIWLHTTLVRKMDDSEIAMVLLESGLSQENWDDYSGIVFALLVLLSSHVLYNGQQLLEDSTVSDLSTIRHLTKHIRTKWMSHEPEDGIRFREILPQVTFVVRDYDAEDLVDGQTDERMLSIKSRAYLESKLVVSGFSDAAEKKNTIRKMIQSCFPKLHCFLFPRAGSACSSAVFSTQCTLLRRYIFTHANFKNLVDIPLSGLLYNHLTEFCVNSLNQTGCLSIPAAWKELNERRCRLALDTAIDVYCNAFNELCHQLPTTDSILQLKHFQQAERARSTFNQKSFDCPRRLQEKFREFLEDHLLCAFKGLSSRNGQLSREAALVVLDRLYEGINSRIEEIQTLGDYETSRMKLRHQFASLTVDLSEQACKTLLAEYLDQKLLLFTQELLSRSGNSSRSPSRAGSRCSAAPTFSPPHSPRILNLAVRTTYHGLESTPMTPSEERFNRDLLKATDELSQSEVFDRDIFGESRALEQLAALPESGSVRALWDAIAAIAQQGPIDHPVVVANHQLLSDRSNSDDRSCCQSSRRFDGWSSGSFTPTDGIAKSEISEFESSFTSSTAQRERSHGPSGDLENPSLSNGSADNPRYSQAVSRISAESFITPGDTLHRPCVASVGNVCAQRNHANSKISNSRTGVKPGVQHEMDRSDSKKETLTDQRSSHEATSTHSDKNPLRDSSVFSDGPSLNFTANFEDSGNYHLFAASRSDDDQDSFNQQDQCLRGIQVMREEMHTSLQAIDYKIRQEMHASIACMQGEVNQLVCQINQLMRESNQQINNGMGQEFLQHIQIENADHDTFALREQLRNLRAEVDFRERLIAQMRQKITSSISKEVLNKARKWYIQDDLESREGHIASLFFLFDVNSILDSLTLRVTKLSDGSEKQCEVTVTTLVKGGAAERSGLIQAGDVLLDVDGIDVQGLEDPVEDISVILASSRAEQDSLFTLTFLRDETQIFSISGPRNTQMLEQRSVRARSKSPEVTVFDLSTLDICTSLEAFVPELRSFSF